MSAFHSCGTEQLEGKVADLFNYNARIVKVIDGDTVDLDVDLGFHVWIRIRTRLLGINAPEAHESGGREATSYLRQLLPVGDPVQIRTYQDPRDKYGRWLAKIACSSAPDVADAMVAAGLAFVWAGSGPKPVG
jgi:micrococcal nuclease